MQQYHYCTLKPTKDCITSHIPHAKCFVEIGSPQTKLPSKNLKNSAIRAQLGEIEHRIGNERLQATFYAGFICYAAHHIESTTSKISRIKTCLFKSKFNTNVNTNKLVNQLSHEQS